MLFKNNKEKVVEIILNNPTTVFSVRELARKSGVSTMTVLNAIKVLENKKIVEKKYKGRNCFIKACVQNKIFVRMKKIYNLQKIYESGLVDFLEECFESPDAIVLFGSYVRGEDSEDSDIDIAVISETNKKTDLRKYEKRLNRSISLHIIKLKNLEKEFILNLANGIVLEGALHEEF